MEAITERVLLERARSYAEKGEAWHYHVLPPSCRYNPLGKYYIIQLQHALDDPAYTIFHREPQEEARALEACQLGEGALQKPARKPVPAMDELQAHAIALAEEGIPWHFHHFPPGCRLNPFRESHALALEDPRYNTVFHAEVGNQYLDAMRLLLAIRRLRFFT